MMNADFSDRIHRFFWWSLLAVCLFAMAVALYYQYHIGEEPCQVCIHIRLWVVGLIVLALVNLVTPKRRLLTVAGYVTAAGCGYGLGERSWYLYQLENGYGDGSCEFQLGMPDWFAVDRWIPSLFEVRNLCSYTPEIFFGISMAEALLFLATAICLGSLTLLVIDRRFSAVTKHA